MRLILGIVFIVAGLAVGASGILRAMAPPQQEPARLGNQVQTAAAVPAPTISVVVMLPAKDSSPAHPVVLAPDTGSKGLSGPGLVQQLQDELVRVGCYDGTVNGSWTAPTREAVKAFLEQVNARLPIEKPDTVLLALLRGHQGQACGVCPAGQQASPDGRCQPNAIVASLEKKSAPLAPIVSGVVPPPAVAPTQRQARRNARREAPIEGRMGIGAGAIATPRAIERRPTKLASADPNPSTPQTVAPGRERRAARHASPRSRAYLRPMRPVRYAYRPFRRTRGLLAAIFGF
jgi:hypothetical protein